MKASKLKVNLNGHLQKPTTEPFARLIYGNIEVQIPYFAFNALKLDLNTDVFGTMRDVFLFAQDEILVEMRHDMSGTAVLIIHGKHFRYEGLMRITFRLILK